MFRFSENMRDYEALANLSGVESDHVNAVFSPMSNHKCNCCGRQVMGFGELFYCELCLPEPGICNTCGICQMCYLHCKILGCSTKKNAVFSPGNYMRCRRCDSYTDANIFGWCYACDNGTNLTHCSFLKNERRNQ